MATPANIPLAIATATALKANDERTSIGEGNGCERESERKTEREQEIMKKKQKIETVSNIPLSEETGDTTSTEEKQQQQKQLPPNKNDNKNKNPPAAAQQQSSRKKKRKLCDRCHRPVPQTCLCEFLPATPITLNAAEVVVLQHPLELKNHKAASHRSLPLLELCLDPSSLTLTTGRRFGTESLGTENRSKLWGGETETAINTSYIPVLVFPRIAVAELEDSATKHAEYREDESTVLSLGGLLELWKRETTNVIEEEDPSCHQQSTKSTNPVGVGVAVDDETKTKVKKQQHKKILLLVLDATWKHAREMHLANIRAHEYPPHMLRLALEPEDFARGGGFVPGRFRLRGKASKTGYKQQQQQQQSSKSKKRNHGDIDESQIGETWMSTAECIAWILSNLEGSSSSSSSNNAEDPNEEREGRKEGSKELSLYEILMKPLDAMVAKWNSYRNNNKSNKVSSSSSLTMSGRKRDRPESEITAIGSNKKAP